MAHEAQAYKDPGTPEEQSRRTFLANATLAVGGVIGLVLTVPLVGSLIPESLVKPNAAGGPVWADLPKDPLKSVTAVDTPVEMTFNFQYADGYFQPEPVQKQVWAVKLSDDEVKDFKSLRPDLFTPGGKVDYDPIVMGFVLYSAICPHLGCQFAWNADAKRFICPCHGSQFAPNGKYLAGPAPRGLDPLPFREKDGKAQVTWIQYKAQQPDRVIVSYD